MADAAFCATHPTEPSLGPCARCGAFVCERDSQLLEGQRYCSTCAVRPDVDWLEAYRLKHWGVRDGWAWLYGLFALPQAAFGVALLFEPDLRLYGVTLLGSAAGGALWWLRVPAARFVVVLSLIAGIAATAAEGSPVGAGGNLLPLLISLVVATSTRTRLFFRLPVTREQLKKLWDIYANNIVARYALSLGILGLLVWPMAPLALLCGVVGLVRVDLQAKPPVGRKGSAIAGIVLGVLGIGIGTTAIATGWFR